MTASNNEEGQPVALGSAKNPEPFRALLDRCDDVLFVRSLSPIRFEYITPSVARLVGYTPDEMYADPGLMRRIVHPEDLDGLERALGGNNPDGTDAVRWLHKNGRAVWVEIRWVKLLEAGVPVAIQGVARDITGRISQGQAQEHLSRSERNIRVILQALPQAVSVSLRGRFLFVNRAMAVLTGYEAEDLLTLSPDAIIPPDDREISATRLAAVLAGETILPREGRILRRDGHIVEAELHAVRIELDAQPALLMFAVDSSERKALHARIALSERLISVGTLAAGVAHEINNPLSFVSMNLSYVLEELATTARESLEVNGLLTALREARTGTDRIRDVVRDLKTFSRADDETRHPLDVAHIVDASLSVAWNEIRHRAQLIKDFQPARRVFASESQLGQVFLNLLLNSAQAIKEGNSDHNEIRVTIRGEGDRVICSISDTGVGIPAEVLPRIFDPFFTTKPVGIGTGLGLSICHGIVASVGGIIRVDSVEGQGTTMTVDLPAVAEEPVAAQVASAPAPKARILVVDDEESVGSSLQRLFKRTHEVRFVTSAQRALHLVRAGDRFDVVLCDLMMPEESGIDLQRELRLLDPTLAARMIFMTGGAFTPEADRFFRQKARWCLEKPFELAAAERLIGEALKAPPPPPSEGPGDGDVRT